MEDLEQLTQTVVARAAALALYARQWLGDGATSAAEDVVQEALTALLMQKHAPPDPVAWMYLAVRNAAIDHARSASRRRMREQSVAKSEWFDATTDSAIDAESAEQALRHLPAEFREVVVLRIWGELGLAQIAQVTQTSVSTVHKRYNAAIEQMRNLLEKPCPMKQTK